MDVSHIFPQCVLPALTLVGGEVEKQWLELVLGMRWDFSSAQWQSLPNWEWGLIPSCWSRSHKVQAQARSVPFKCVFFPLPTAFCFKYAYSDICFNIVAITQSFLLYFEFFDILFNGSIFLNKMKTHQNVFCHILVFNSGGILFCVLCEVST